MISSYLQVILQGFTMFQVLQARYSNLGILKLGVVNQPAILSQKRLTHDCMNKGL